MIFLAIENKRLLKEYKRRIKHNNANTVVCPNCHNKTQLYATRAVGIDLWNACCVICDSPYYVSVKLDGPDAEEKKVIEKIRRIKNGRSAHR